MTYTEVLQAAKGQMGFCHACPVCNGRACGGTIPGPGAKGSGTVAVRNFDAWRNVRLNMDTIHENFTPDTSLQLFGRTFKYPFFAGPVGAMTLHYGDKYDDLTYNDILVTACAGAGIAAFTGDGTNPDVMTMATKAIGNADGCGVPTIKPWNIDLVREKAELVGAADPIAVAMDIDAAGLPLLGVIPEDPDVPYCLNRGLVLREQNYYAARAYENIAKRIMGQKTPLMKI